jgi:hypothetical protein
MTTSSPLGDQARGPEPSAARPAFPTALVLRRRRRFFEHLLAFAGGAVLLTAAWLVSGVLGDDWFYWPLFVLLPWALALDVHAWWAYRARPDPLPPDDGHDGA